MKTIRFPMTFASVVITVALHAQTPVLNSYPLAAATVYLDFDGQYVEGTIWNTEGPIDAHPAKLSAGNITEIFNRVAEDFHPFNINITTSVEVYNKAPLLQRIKIIFTSTSNWYGNASGASFVGSFTWGDDTPAWVFSDQLGNNPRYLAACAAHEIGHTLGLQHQSIYDGDCHKITEYNPGIGTLETGWAPIMGVSYYKNCATWSTGTSAINCDSIQSDLGIIAGSPNNFGFRTDDYGDDQTKATAVNIYSHSFSVKGMINQPRDRDAFRVDINSRKELRLHAITNNTGYKGNTDLAIKISVLNAHGDTLGRYDRIKLLYEGIDMVLDPGTYFLIVEDAGNKDHSSHDKPEFYALSGALIDEANFRQFALSHW